MATPASSPSKQDYFKLPIAPPGLHIRSDNEQYVRPLTPTRSAFVSPPQTPQGSPSKKQLPPGASDLPDFFANALKLIPTAGNINKPAQQNAAISSPASPQKSRAPLTEDKANDFRASVIQARVATTPGSPLAKSGKENTPPPARPILDSFPSQAAVSRQELYKPKENSLAKRTTHGLTPEILEKLQKPSVKRLTNVTQLYFLDYYFDLLSYVHNRQTRHAQFNSQNPAPAEGKDSEYDAALHKYLGRERAYLRKRRTRLRYGDFRILTQVGQGGYGQVYLAKKRDTNEVCALKVLSKKLLFKMDEVRHVLTERDILSQSKSEWLVRLLYAFQDDNSIYLAMEYVPGGDFRTLLNNTGVLHNRHARFYIAEMFQCVDSLHQLGYIHRDLKPENFLVDSQGHVKLTDFGLAAGMLVPAKIESMRLRLEQVGNSPVPFSASPMQQRTVTERQQAYRSLRERDQNYAKSTVGSPDYMAPEVLSSNGGKSYDFTVDYWSLGCMLFEALAGYPPFAGASVEETWQNLKHWKTVFKKPIYEDPSYYLSHRTWDLITRCITTPEKRFKSFAEIKAHPYFSEVNFSELRDPEKGPRAPFIPELDGETDAGYFDDFSNEKDMAKYKDVQDRREHLEKMEENGQKMAKSLFVGFTFRHRKANPNDRKGLGELKEVDESNFGTMF